MKRYIIATITVSLLLIGLYSWWFQSPLIMTAIYTGLALLFAATVPAIYHIAGFSLQDTMDWVKEKESIEHNELKQRLTAIRGELEQLGSAEGVRQADILTGIIDDYHAVVETRFLGKKHSPLTYLSAARSVQKHAVQNLTDVIAVSHSVSTIQRNQRGNDHIKTDQQHERHEKRNVLLEEQEARLQTLFEENNMLFNSLMDTAVEVANIQSFSQFERTDTLARLVGLANIARHS